VSDFIDQELDDKQPLLQRSVSRLPQLLRASWSSFVDTITPPQCLSCHTPINAGAGLCVVCWQKLNHLDEPVCDALGTPFEFDHGEGALSAAAIAEPPSWDKARAAVVFDEASKPLVHQLKYHDHQEAGLVMAKMMAQAGRHLIKDCNVILPVPLHWMRLWRRRFNQAAFLGQHISKSSGKPCVVDVLNRETATRQQVGLTAAERRKNVRRAFAIAPEKRAAVDGKRVLLIDDIRTTGATVSACTEVLRDAGATQVYVLTFALVLQALRPHID
jgi:ComF family protein